MPVFDTPVIKNLKELERVKSIRDGDLELTTLHLFSSCPMGEDQSKCAVNSYGRLHQFDNVYLNDASILPEAQRGRAPTSNRYGSRSPKR